MKLFTVVQAFYAISGIAFFVRDLFNKVPMSEGMVNAFIWPYAQWPFIKAQVMANIAPVMQMVGQ